MARKHKSPIKRAKQDAKRHERNVGYKRSIHTVTRKIFELVEAGDKESAVAELKSAQAHIDSAVSKGILHRNTAARRVSRIARAIAK